MPMTEAELETEYDRLTALIQTVTATPKPSYRIGSISKNWTEYLKELRAQRAEVMEQLRGIPYEGVSIVDFGDE